MKKAENTGNYIDISFSNKRNNVFLLLLYKSYYLNLVTFACLLYTLDVYKRQEISRFICAANRRLFRERLRY